MMLSLTYLKSPPNRKTKEKEVFPKRIATINRPVEMKHEQQNRAVRSSREHGGYAG